MGRGLKEFGAGHHEKQLRQGTRRRRLSADNNGAADAAIVVDKKSLDKDEVECQFLLEILSESFKQ